MAVSQKPDFDAMIAELETLERKEREISALRRRLQDRIDAFPTELLKARERQVSDERRELHRRIDLLRAELGLPLTRTETGSPV